MINQDILKLVAEQAEDEGLWFIAETAPEAYVQGALRRLHTAIEKQGGKYFEIPDPERFDSSKDYSVYVGNVDIYGFPHLGLPDLPNTNILNERHDIRLTKFGDEITGQVDDIKYKLIDNKWIIDND